MFIIFNNLLLSRADWTNYAVMFQRLVKVLKIAPELGVRFN